MGYDLSPASRADFINELLTQDTRACEGPQATDN
jgi:hypothetical protein